MQSSVEVKLTNVVGDEYDNLSDAYQVLSSPTINSYTPAHEFTPINMMSQETQKSSHVNISSPKENAADDSLHDQPLEPNENKAPDSKTSSEISVAYAVKILFLSTITGAVTGYAAVMATLIDIRSHDYNEFMCDFYNKNATDYGCNFTWPSLQMDCSGTSSLTCSFQNQSNSANQAASDYAEPLAQNAVMPLLVPSLVAGVLGGGVLGFFAGAVCLKKKMQSANSSVEAARPSSPHTPNI